ncbi:MAG: DUF2855 family protein [Actinomycetota bacterium]|nr:DUF2855 family protein [Actinomycetota bacterium]
MQFEVDRHDLQRVRVVQPPAAALQPGQARLLVRSFALTSNNITYAVFGDALQYWQFFPAAGDDGEAGGGGAGRGEAGGGEADTAGAAGAGAGQEEPVQWGRVPVWGFADVVETTVGSLAEGARVYGYLPMATELIVQPGRLDDRGFSDTAAHRAAMAAAYNRYVYAAADPVYDTEREPHQMVLWPLFFTSFVIDDMLADSGFLGGCVVVSSASSKTAIGVAHLLSRRAGVRVVGLTSAANAEFVGELGCYHDVVTYDALAAGGTGSGLPVGTAAYVDIAGDATVTRAVHQHFGDRLVHSMIVGGTHWNAAPPTAGGEGEGALSAMRGPSPQFFFAPTQIAKRTHEWGRDGLEARTTEAWTAYRDWADEWLHFHRAFGPAEVEHTYRELLAGRVDPRVGHVCTMEPR